MAKIHAPIAGALMALTCPLPGQRLDDAEVRIPYGELKQLLARAEPVAAPETPKTALLSARLRISMADDRARIAGTFRTLAFSDSPGLVPLIGGDVSLDQQEPADAAVILNGKNLCLVTDTAGSRTLDLQLLPMAADGGFSIHVPPCPAVILETGDLPADRAIAVRWEQGEATLGSGRLLPMPNSGVKITIRVLDQMETREALLPPEPSEPAWQNEGVVKQAEWSLKVEPDGSTLATGKLLIEHKGPFGFILAPPADMDLLSCELADQPLAPTELDDGRLKLPLPAGGGVSQITCAFTRAAGALDPVEGTLALTLPSTPSFIHALQWCIDLPVNYQAETHGNLTRMPSPGGPPSRILLVKNLCRDERPDVRIFYQRADLNR